MSVTQDRADGARSLAASGIEGLDDVLRGGFTRDRLYLIQGVPGSGKTTMAMQFLLEGARQGEKVLYVTLSETEAELRTVAESHGWSTDGVDFHELIPSAESLGTDEHYTMFHPSEVELNQTTHVILSEVERLRPARVVFDSLSEVRLLAGGPLRYRRQVLSLKRYFAGRSCTVMLLDDLTSDNRDLQVQSIAHGVLHLEQLNPEYGAERRRLMIMKYRGISFRGGYHDFLIRRGGLEVFPRLVAAEHRRTVEGPRVSSGIVEIDRLLGGGLEPGTSTLILGAPGTGKSSIAAKFLACAAEKGRRGMMLVFDESIHTLMQRALHLGSDLQPHCDSGLVQLVPVDPAELSPGEFAHRIRVAVEQQGTQVIVIDSLNGYMNAMPNERYLLIHMHELLNYLGQKGAVTVITSAHRGLLGPSMEAPVDATYLADAAILLRYFEARGAVHQAISVLKKRGGHHERSIRELRLEDGNITVSEPLTSFRGILTGVPEYHGEVSTLMEVAGE